MREYDLISEWYASEPIDQTGVPEVTALATSIPRRSLVLNVGCGIGLSFLAVEQLRSYQILTKCLSVFADGF